MRTLIHSLRLLAMMLWVGGIVFFAFVLAPTVFSPAIVARMHGVALSGAVVGDALGKLNSLGMVSGAVFLLGTATVFRRAPHPVRGRYEMQMLLAGLMIIATGYLAWNVIPAMERDRTLVGGDIETAPRQSPERMHFDRLHVRSERVEGFVLLCGLGVVVLMSREMSET